MATFSIGDLNYTIIDPSNVTVFKINTTIVTANIPATVDISGTTYNVTTISVNAFLNCTSLTSVTIPNSVTSIGANAFQGCTSLTSITIPNSVTSIGQNAFQGCNKLTSITIPNSVTSIGANAFFGCTSLTSVTFDSSSNLTTISSRAFQNCTALTSVFILASVTSIGSNAFFGCTSLTSITVDISNPNYSSDISGVLFNKAKTTLIQFPLGLSGSYTIPNSVTSIGTIPASVTSIGFTAFQNCTSLTSVTIPASVTSIGSAAFSGCTILTSVTFDPSSNLTTIGSNAFFGCTSLTSIFIPASVTSIGAGAFDGCSSLTSITVDISNPNYSSDISGVLFNKAKTTLIRFPPGLSGSYTIPASVTSIGANAFQGCTGLTSVTFDPSSNLTSIGANAFQGCNKLTSITIPNLVTSIGASAFNGASSLTSITIPNSVTSIGANAFQNCNKLTSVTIPASVTSIGNSAFSGCTSLTSITVDISNPNYSFDISGVLFNKSKTTLIQFPPGLSGSYTIPDSVTSIGNNAFNGCTGLTSVTIPASVTSIDFNAFQSCNNLTSVYFLSNIPTIGLNNFTNTSDTAYYYQDFSANISSLNSFFTNVLPMTTPTFGINDTISKTYGSNFKLDPSSNSLGAFTFISSDLTVATVDASGNVTPVSIGTCNIIINQNPNSNFGPATKIVNLTVTAPISNICFPSKTPIVTNQGIIHIDKINPEIHTIRNKKIVAITKTVSQDKYLICFEKDALGTNMPSQKTIITQNHEILYKGRMTKAKDFLQNFENVKKVKYSGEVLYNVLMEEHNKMVVNNLICETLHPENGVAKLQMVLQNLNSEQQEKIVKEYNNYVIKNNVYSSKKITK